MKLSSLGDIVHSLHVLDALRRSVPGATIDWVISRSFAPLLVEHPSIDELHIFERNRWGQIPPHPSFATEFSRFVGKLRRRRYDLAIDLQGLFRSGLITYASGANRRIGFDRRREHAHWFYTDRVTFPQPEIHAIDRNLELIRHLDLDVTGAVPHLPISEVARTRVDSLLLDHGVTSETCRVAIFPQGRWASKVWPLEHVAGIFERLHSRNIQTLLLGSNEDRELPQRLATLTSVPFVDLVGKTNLPELIALIEKVDLVVGHDSGPMHIASTLQVPSVFLFGPSSPVISGPYGSPGRVLHATELECISCMARKCPLGTIECMQRMDADRVAPAIFAELEKSGRL